MFVFDGSGTMDLERWIWNDGYESDEAHLVTYLIREHGFQVTVEKVLEQGGGSTWMA
jgi:hypothetical protein